MEETSPDLGKEEMTTNDKSSKDTEENYSNESQDHPKNNNYSMEETNGEANIAFETKESDHETNKDLKTDGICGSNDNNKESDKESPEYEGKELVDEKKS